MQGSNDLRALCIFEDDRFPRFFPLTLDKPVFDLLIGTQTLLDRICAEVTHGGLSVICRDRLADAFSESATARRGGEAISVNAVPERETLFINGRLLAYGEELPDLLAGLETGEILEKNGVAVAARLPGETAAGLAAYLRSALTDQHVERVMLHLRDLSAPQPKKKTGGELPSGYGEKLTEWAAKTRVKVRQADVRLLSYVWQMIGENGPCLVDDFLKNPMRGMAPESALYRGVDLIREEDIVIGPDVEVRSGTVLDASGGPVVIATGALIEPTAIIYGPRYIGEHAIVRGGAKIGHGTSIGASCRVGGEIGETIIAPCSNKQHEGFLGHSYIGSWVNIGAGSCNSDLKNNYGMIKAWSAGQTRDTGRRFLGFVCGAHAKIAINTRINTGTVIGYNANVFTDGFPPKFVPSFTWAIEPEFSEFDIEKAIETAGIMMDRRERAQTESQRELMRAIFRHCRLAQHNV
jgi:UDP-N-acetylglucosamine diphosphorylase/glucosamine-1-phosphate N-acetyltransferase